MYQTYMNKCLRVFSILSEQLLNANQRAHCCSLKMAKTIRAHKSLLNYRC